MRCFVVCALVALPGLQAAPTGDEKFINLFDKLRSRSAPRQVRVAAPPESRTCSVPLKEMTVKNPEQFTSQRVPVKEVEPMPKVALPAPPCETR